MELETFLQKHFNHTVDNYEFTEEDMQQLIALIKGNVKDGKTFTENGLKILKTMKENAETYMNIYSSKQLGELLFMSPRSVSGSMKKLIANGYVEKVSLSPVTYSLTTLGKDYQFDKE